MTIVAHSVELKVGSIKGWHCPLDLMPFTSISLATLANGGVDLSISVPLAHFGQESEEFVFLLKSFLIFNGPLMAPT